METTSATLNVNLVANNKKIATHSHIKGLGLKEDGYAEPQSSGFVGQHKAREVRNMNGILYLKMFLSF